MSKTYKNGLFKKNSYKSPKIRIFEKIRTKTDFKKKICTCTDKSVRVGTLPLTPKVTPVTVGIFVVLLDKWDLENPIG